MADCDIIMIIVIEVLLYRESYIRKIAVSIVSQQGDCKGIIAEVRCVDSCWITLGTVDVDHRVLESFPGWLHCLPLACNCPRSIARAWSVGEIAVVPTALGVSPCC
jgi:hypothetical protein